MWTNLTIYMSYNVLLRKELPFGGCGDCTCIKILVPLIQLINFKHCTITNKIIQVQTYRQNSLIRK